MKAGGSPIKTNLSPEVKKTIPGSKLKAISDDEEDPQEEEVKVAPKRSSPSKLSKDASSTSLKRRGLDATMTPQVKKDAIIAVSQKDKNEIRN